MRKMLACAAVVAVVATAALVMIRSTPTDAAPRVSGPSVAEMMATAKDLPVAPTPDAI
jgi:hypothetical protein